MSDVITLLPSRSSSLRSVRGSTSTAWADNWLQAQNEQHLIQGYSASNLQRFASLLAFNLGSMSTVDKLIKAELHVFTAADHVGMKTQSGVPLSQGNLRVAAKLAQWVSAGGGEALWNGAAPDGVTAESGTYKAYAHVTATALQETVINVTSLVRYWAPKTVKYGSAFCLGKPNYGMVMQVAGTVPFSHETVLASDHHPNAGIRPFLVLTVELKGGPGIVLISEPNGDVPAGTPLLFTGEYEPGRTGDKIATVDIKRMGGGLADKTWTIIPSATDIAASTFAVQLPESLPLATSFTWAARVKNSAGNTTPYSAALPVRLVGTPPDLTVTQPNGVTVESLLSVPFQATVNVPPTNYRAERWRIQLRTDTLSTDPTWGDAVLWDSGPMPLPLSPTERLPVTGAAVTQRLSTPYGGPTLVPGTYVWRAQASDIFGATSPWVYATFITTAPYVPTPGDTVNLTGYAPRPPHRIRLYAVDLGAGKGRGPGVLLAELTDAANVGASEFYNSAGEFFFTLPATHPQVAVIEPYQVHYELQLHTGEGWRGKAYGLITDFDATEDEVVFYGTDYPGLLARSVEERFSPTDSELSTDAGGGKYNKKTISFIITDQLNRAKAATNSPIGFITVGDIASIPEQVTIYSSFKRRLPFISGLIDSAKAGTGRKTRLVCERAANGTFKWRLLLDPGITRDNLRLEYGGLVQGFRTVPFGSWGTSVAGVGRTVKGDRVYSALAVAPGVSEPTYGHWPSLSLWSDIDDLTDLRRRSAQAAVRASKVGKQMGLGLRVGSLSIKDGWDICDSVPVDIKRGVVDTSRFGSGYWTLWGWTWNSYPDGHDNLTLSMTPREDSIPSNPDLIPSAPILSPWQVGYGVPGDWGAPPTPTPEPGAFAEGDPEVSLLTLPLSTDSVVAESYMDLNTGCVYTLDTTTDTYTETYCPDTSGGGGGTPPDATPPAKPVIKSTASTSVTQDDGTSLTTLFAVVGYTTPPVGLTDLDHYTMESTRFRLLSDATQPDWSLATQWGTQSADATGTLDTNIIQPGVHSGTSYFLRVYAFDKSGNRSIVSDAVQVTSATDTVGPPQPTDVVTTAGMSTIGVRWGAIPVEDLAYVEVEWRESVGPGTWQSIQVGGTLVVITGVTNGTTYDIRVRSVDTSGNTQKTDGTSVQAVDDPEAGWVDGADATPTALPGSALVWDSAIIEDIFAGELDADWITTGTLKVGVGAGNADAIEVYNNAGKLIGRWSGQEQYLGGPPIGIEVLDPANLGYKLRINNSSLVIYTAADTANPIPVVTMSPLGIDAASITFGSARGGHNLVQNSSFELGRFAVSAVVQQTWDVAADWTATRVGADVNITPGASTLTMAVI